MVIKQGIILLLLFCIGTISSSTCPSTAPIKCSTGICVDSTSKCPIDISCPDDYFRINLYTCSKSEDFRVPSKCETDSECWDGTCQDDPSSKCPTMNTCPSSYNVRCPDNSCVSSIEECPNIFSCPSFIPIRCPNGDCRKSLDDCPSLLQCPNSFSILCNDGSCRMISDNCVKASEETQCIDNTMTRCPDGTCTTAKFLCPTPTTCPSGYVKCWDGNCAKDQSKCKSPESGQSSTCPSDKIVCPFDFSCATEISLCPTGIICPVDRPVRCWDMSCKESISSCPPYQECPAGTIACPDGSCSVESSCGTHITCSTDAPFKCYDNTCRKNPEDCPTQPNCPSEAPILCWDGRCLANREDCISPKKCSGNTLVKCPDFICKNSIEECKEITECPNTFSRCSNGDCRLKLADCEESQCPLTFPVKCDNGMCVSDESHCEKENGCPFNKPNKCKDGSCVADTTTCPNFSESDCPVDTHLCEDGSCLPKGTTCPEANGCPVDTPRKCADGTCIDPKKATCPIPTCPSDTPIRCLDGTCATTTSNCPNTIKTTTSEGLVHCADGVEAYTFEECKPLLSCSANQVRCNDGTCREDSEYCPKANTCPDNKIRCSNGSCATTQNECYNLSGCPKSTPNKCPSSGLCVANMEECNEYEEQFPGANGCPRSAKIKCSNGKCVSNLENCVNENGCTSDKPILCPDGKCDVSQRACRKHSATCADDYVQCPDDNVPCAKSFDQCFNSFNCKIESPFRCLSGECKRYPLQRNSADTNGCEIGIECPEYKPYLCADGECVEKSTFCKSLTECPSDKPYRCFDRTCVASSEECSSSGKKCPAKTPILCPNANCVSNLFDCSETLCPTWKPYKCANGQCKTTPRECLEQIQKDDSVLYLSVCNENEVTCNDGTCRLSLDECPMFSGCASSSEPFKCPNGLCVASEDKCVDLTTKCDDEEKPFKCPKTGVCVEKEEQCEATEVKCEEGLTLCEDAICRKECPSYNGCPFSKPLMCSTGKCVTSISECVGEGNCVDVDKPFRCIDGSCASSISNCPSPKRGFGTTNIKISVYPEYDLTSDIIIGENNLVIGSIYVPSDTLSKEGKSISGTIKVKSVLRSDVQETYSTYNETRTEDLLKVFPYADPESNYTLEYEYTVLSSAVSISLDDAAISFKKNILLTLAYDFPGKHESLQVNETEALNATTKDFMSLSPLEDVCLAKLEGKLWKCVGGLTKTESLDNYQLQGALNTTGIYAVILNLRINTTPLNIEYNFLIEHLTTISILTVIVLIIIGICIYVFMRIYRYRGKYKDTSNKFKNVEMEMNSMQDSSTDIIGQTIGDTKEGVVFTDNPAFKLVRDEQKSKRTIQLEKMHDNYTKRLRTLERNNQTLKASLDNIKAEYDRLIKYKETLGKGDKVDIVIKE